MNPYIGASKIAPLPGQAFTLLSYQFEGFEGSQPTEPVRGPSQPGKSVGIVTVFKSSDDAAGLMESADYMQNELKMPNVMVIETCQPAEVRKYSDEPGEEHEPIASSRTLLEKHRQDMNWFHPTYQLRTHARLLKELEERADTPERITTLRLAQVVEWRQEMDQLQKMAAEIANRRDRVLRMLQGSPVWNEEDTAFVTSESDAAFLAEMVDEFKALAPVEPETDSSPEPLSVGMDVPQV